MGSSRGDAKTADHHSYVVIGCPRATHIGAAVLRAALKAIKHPAAVRQSDHDGASEFARVLFGLRSSEFAGAAIWGPLRTEAFDACDEADTSARRSVSASVLVACGTRQLAAYNADVLGIVDQVQQLGITPRTAVVFGAGTEALAACAACEALGVKVIVATSRSWKSTEDLMDSDAADRMRRLGVLTSLWPAATGQPARSHLSEVMSLQFSDVATTADLVIQATPATLIGSDPREILRAMPWDRLRQGVVAVDLACRADPSLFVMAARRQGVRTVTGLDMLAGQAARVVEVWTGLRPPLAPVQIAAERATAELDR